MNLFSLLENSGQEGKTKDLPPRGRPIVLYNVYLLGRAASDHGRSAHARAHDPDSPLLFSFHHPFPSPTVVVLSPALRSPSSRIDGGDLQFGAAECRSAARGGCRRGRRNLPRACNSPWREGERDGGTMVAGDCTGVVCVR